jgi:hypothetical protein
MSEDPIYVIRRTRLITEWFRVEAPSQAEACEILDGAVSPIQPEQLELQTWYSNIDSIEVT